jgi:hypothetical protein
MGKRFISAQSNDEAEEDAFILYLSIQERSRLPSFIINAI